MRLLIQTSTNCDNTRKVEIFQHADKTFGFEELRFAAEEGCWIPYGHRSDAHMDTLEHTISEAKRRVTWLNEQLADE